MRYLKRGYDTMAKDKGLIHIYCGENKGKTTACVGQAVRAFGSGFKVIFCQFLKTSPSGELKSLEQLGINSYRITKPKGFTWEMNEEELALLKEEHNKLFKEVTSLIEGDGDKTLLVLDELVGAYVGGHIDKEMVMDFLNNKPKNLEVVLTGRNPSEELMEIADYITEMKKIKHPMDKGINARKGIEM